MDAQVDRDNKMLLLGCRFALIKLGIAEGSPLWNWMQQEFQSWLTGGYEQVLRNSITNAQADSIRFALRHGAPFTRIQWSRCQSVSKPFAGHPLGVQCDFPKGHPRQQAHYKDINPTHRIAWTDKGWLQDEQQIRVRTQSKKKTKVAAPRRSGRRA